MKKLFFCISLFLFSIFTLYSQTIKIEKSYSLSANIQKGFHPVLNTNGSLLAFTSESYQGLAVYDFSNKSTLKISDEPGAGFQPVFSDDNKLHFKNTVYKSNLKYEGLKSYDLQKKTIREELEPQRNLRSALNYGANNKGTTQRAWSDGRNLNIEKDGKIEILNPVENANGYIWASLSPDKKMILFNAVSVGTFVADLKGNIIASLGYLNAPVWYDNEFVAGMQDKDDGYNITESKVIIKNLAGSITKILSEPDQIAMYPTASSVAGKIAYNTIEGDIYILEIEVKK